MSHVNITHVLINGCSHSAGSEIEASGIGDGNYNRDNSFGASLAKRMGATYTNIAYPGASNDYIARTTQYWILDNKELAKNTLFLIHWTGTDRTEYFYDNGYTGQFDFIPYAPDKQVAHLHPQHYPDWAPSEWKTNLQQLSNHLFINHTQWDINRYNNIILTQEFLKSNNCRYIFRNAFQCCSPDKRYQYYIDKIDKDNFLHFDNAEQSFYEHCLDKGFDTKGQKYWHHKLEAHNYWANLLFNLL
tara:strand:+ start:316 stop:1050 length:735 start_codon:yes stop_codon:yes gene_type:complete